MDIKTNWISSHVIGTEKLTGLFGTVQGNVAVGEEDVHHVDGILCGARVVENERQIQAAGRLCLLNLDSLRSPFQHRNEPRLFLVGAKR